jgi:hypothetical protein
LIFGWCELRHTATMHPYKKREQRHIARIKGFIKIPIKLKKLKYEGQGKTP